MVEKEKISQKHIWQALQANFMPASRPDLLHGPAQQKKSPPPCSFTMHGAASAVCAM